MMYTMPKNLLSICVNFALATQLSKEVIGKANDTCVEQVPKDTIINR